MPEENQLQAHEAFLTRCTKFVSAAVRADLMRLFPGLVSSPGECLFPVRIDVPGTFQKFRITEGMGEERSLCFSKVIFVGKLDGDAELRDLGEFATCSISSLHQNSKGAQLGITGSPFANNVHTAKEANPWWEVTFPPGVKVWNIYLYRRADWHVTNESNLRILGVDDKDEETALYFPEKFESSRSETIAMLEKAVQAMQQLAATAPEDVQEQVIQKLDEAFIKLDEWLAQWSQSSALTLDTNVPNVAADLLVEAVSLAIGGAKDFGYSPETGLVVEFGDLPVRQVRLRAFGELPPGMAGFELYEAGTGELLHSFDKAALKFRYHISPFEFPDHFGVGLTTKVMSRRLDLGEAQNLGRFRTWNLNLQHAANTLFLEIAVRAEKKGPWQVIHDHGVTYRYAVAALHMINALIKSSWTPNYAALLGKLFSQYRRKGLMTPLARFVRDRELLNKAVFKGSDEIWPKTKYAAPLRLGKHGLRVPVAFRDEKVIMSQMTEMRDKVRALGHKPLLMYGTLLGAIRERDFIPHDDDVDLAVIMPDTGPDELNDACVDFIKLLNDNGVKATRGAAHSPLIHCHRGAVTYDIFILGQQGDTVYWPHTALKVVPERADIFLPTKLLEFKGEEFDGPNDPEAVCLARYGEGWKVPNPSFEW